MKEKSRRRIKRDQARRDPRARLASAKATPAGVLDAEDDEHEAEQGTGELEHEEARRILGYDE
jgi:hypothetical protein